jgi:hypothetical protein
MSSENINKHKPPRPFRGSLDRPQPSQDKIQSSYAQIQDLTLTKAFQILTGFLDKPNMDFSELALQKKLGSPDPISLLDLVDIEGNKFNLYFNVLSAYRVSVPLRRHNKPFGIFYGAAIAINTVRSELGDDVWSQIAITEQDVFDQREVVPHLIENLGQVQSPIEALNKKVTSQEVQLTLEDTKNALATLDPLVSAVLEKFLKENPNINGNDLMSGAFDVISLLSQNVDYLEARFPKQ